MNLNSHVESTHCGMIVTSASTELLMLERKISFCLLVRVLL